MGRIDKSTPDDLWHTFLTAGPRGVGERTISSKGAYEALHSMLEIDHFTDLVRDLRSARQVLTVRKLGWLIRDTFFRWIADNPFQMAAALAYYTLFSIAPLLLIAIAVAGSLFGREASQEQLIGTIQDFVGFQSAHAIQAMVESANQRPQSGFYASAVGMILLLLGAGGVVGQLQDSLNTIWRVTSKPGRGIIGFAKDRLVSYSMVLAVGFLLVVSLVVTSI